MYRSCIHIHRTVSSRSCMGPYASTEHTAAQHIKLQYTVIYCNTLLNTGTLWNTLQHTATHCTLSVFISLGTSPALQHATAHCNTLQHTATRCNTLQHAATHCNTLQALGFHFFGYFACNAARYSTLQHTAIHCNTLQHAATRCNTLQHTCKLSVSSSSGPSPPSSVISAPLFRLYIRISRYTNICIYTRKERERER